jgi:hypothetical protein
MGNTSFLKYGRKMKSRDVGIAQTPEEHRRHKETVRSS